ncbi:MAG: GGDEF domain-containing protein, partial [Actinomycetota bacterium]
EINLKNPFKILSNNLKSKNEELQFIATHDSLTGLSNQSSIFEELGRQFEIAKRFSKNFSIIMIDIDDFKIINDSFGHIAGDNALKFMADIINKTVRDLDIKGRYGGDEFLISPIEVSELKALEIAQKIQENLRLYKLPSNCPFKKFTISAGVSGIRAKRTFDQVLATADKALLKSKQLGKDRVTFMK